MEYIWCHMGNQKISRLSVRSNGVYKGCTSLTNKLQVSLEQGRRSEELSRRVLNDMMQYNKPFRLDL
ncbi:hypothetical protein CTI12_AA020490 [Artemisia annua]|uniref:Uncharacterized protein n=1 Tax=Artemisia annua TaxID=35608 RepID=A0A2U1Q6J2_ARTAN|nr:hypothetical protein CTI12_AA020490 [Artemisia annua]